MSQPSGSRPVPGPSAGPAPRPVPGEPAEDARPVGETPGSTGAAALAGLAERPVAEHVDVFQTEHARLERELRTIDEL